MRIVTLVALLVLLAGCSALGGPPSTDQPSGTATTATPMSNCTAATLLTDDGTESVTPEPLPNPPERFDANVAGQFAQAYERAFAHNHKLGSTVQSVLVDMQGTAVEAHGDGYHVRIHVWIQATHEGKNGTTTSESFYDAHYYVSSHVLRRIETARHDNPEVDVRSAGVTLACWS